MDRHEQSTNRCRYSYTRSEAASSKYSALRPDDFDGEANASEFMSQMFRTPNGSAIGRFFRGMSFSGSYGPWRRLLWVPMVWVCVVSGPELEWFLFTADARNVVERVLSLTTPRITMRNTRQAIALDRAR